MTLRRLLQALAACLILTSTASTAAEESLPAWAVPVLRLVSATHVEPTTGIVVSSDGLVLVPGEFGSPEDEIVVLDGGTDIVRHGRPARMDKRLEYVGLKLIQVDGLARRPAVFAETLPADGTPVWLAAFPPAERIAEGAPPLWEERRMVTTPGSRQTALSLSSPLPNVTGALVDACGYVLGLSIHAGVQDMAPSPQTRYRWSAEVQDALNAQQVDTRTTTCDPQTGAAEGVVESEPAAVTEPETQPNDLPEPEPEPEAEPEPDPELPQAELDETDLADLEELPPMEGESTSRLTWLLAAVLLFLAGAGIHWWRRRSAGEPAPESILPATDSDGWQPPAMTHRLVVSGQDQQGREFECACPVSDQAINCVVGSGDVDLVIALPGVSPGHARIFGTGDALMVTACEPGGEIFVNGVPCLQDETFYIEESTPVQIGPVLCTVKLEPAEET